MELLLLSNSSSDRGYLVDALFEIEPFARGVREAAFVPYAGVTRSWDAYEARVAEALAPTGLRMRSVHRASDPAAAVREADLVDRRWWQHVQPAAPVPAHRRAEGAGGACARWHALYRVERRRQPRVPDDPHDERYAGHRPGRVRCARSRSVPDQSALHGRDSGGALWRDPE